MIRSMKFLTCLVIVCLDLLCATNLADAQDESPKVPSIDRLVDLAAQRAKILNCIDGNISKFDDRLSPANVVASAVAWHCEADSKPENYWIILSMRRSTPDTVDMFYRDLALPFVLQYRAKQIKSN